MDVLERVAYRDGSLAAVPLPVNVLSIETRVQAMEGVEMPRSAGRTPGFPTLPRDQM